MCQESTRFPSSCLHMTDLRVLVVCRKCFPSDMDSIETRIVWSPCPEAPPIPRVLKPPGAQSVQRYNPHLPQLRQHITNMTGPVSSLVRLSPSYVVENTSFLKHAILLQHLLHLKPGEPLYTEGEWDSSTRSRKLTWNLIQSQTVSRMAGNIPTRLLTLPTSSTSYTKALQLSNISKQTDLTCECLLSLDCSPVQHCS